MENQEYVFKPAGDPPNKENLKRNFIKSVALIAVCCSFASWFETSAHQIYFLLAFIIISLIAFLLRITTKFVRSIRIDPEAGILYMDYINYQGKESTTIFDLKRSKYSYKFKPSMGIQGFVLSIEDKTSKLKIIETRLKKSKDQKNGFYRDQLDCMDGLIRAVRSEVKSATIVQP